MYKIRFQQFLSFIKLFTKHGKQANKPVSEYPYNKVSSAPAEARAATSSKNAVKVNVPKDKIALVVGHRQSSKGAYGSAGLAEWDYWNEFSLDLLDLLASSDIEVRVFHRKEKGSGYNQRMVDLHREIDSWGAKISISMHFNASANGSANGHEVLYCESSKTSANYAGLMNRIFTDNLDNRDRGIKKKSRKDRGGGFLCRGNSYCILVEPFFASNQHEYMRGQIGREKLLLSFKEFLFKVA